MDACNLNPEQLLASFCLDTEDNYTKAWSSKVYTSFQGHSPFFCCKDLTSCTVSMGCDCDSFPLVMLYTY